MRAILCLAGMQICLRHEPLLENPAKSLGKLSGKRYCEITSEKLLASRPSVKSVRQRAPKRNQQRVLMHICLYLRKLRRLCYAMLVMMQKQKLQTCARLQVYPGRRPIRPTTAAEAGEREYCYRSHSEWALLDALHSQLDHLSAHERRKRLRHLQVSLCTCQHDTQMQSCIEDRRIWAQCIVSNIN